MLLNCSISLPNFCLPHLSITESNIFRSPSTMMDLSISPCKYVNFICDYFIRHNELEMLYLSSGVSLLSLCFDPLSSDKAFCLKNYFI